MSDLLCNNLRGIAEYLDGLNNSDDGDAVRYAADEILRRKARIAELEAQFAAAERDVERYQWLRGHSYVYCDMLAFGRGFKQSKPEYLDAIIDSARKQNANPE